MTIRIFQDNDAGYLLWTKANPNGFVVNTRRRSDPEYLVLHRASCPTVLVHRGMDQNPGGFTERGYQKICGKTVQELRAHLSLETGRSSPFTKRCTRCNP